MLNKLLHEPLIHFCFIGVVLFALFGMVCEPERDKGNRLVVTQAHMDRLSGGQLIKVAVHQPYYRPNSSVGRW